MPASWLNLLLECHIVLCLLKGFHNPANAIFLSGLFSVHAASTRCYTALYDTHNIVFFLYDDVIVSVMSIKWTLKEPCGAFSFSSVPHQIVLCYDIRKIFFLYADSFQCYERKIDVQNIIKHQIDFNQPYCA